MKSLNLRKLSLLTVLAGSLLSYNAHAAAEDTTAAGVTVHMPRVARPVVADPTAKEVAAATQPIHRTCIQTCFPCCSSAVQETVGDWVGVAARGFSFVAEYGDDILGVAESIFGKSDELDALKRAQSIAARTTNELSLVLNPKTGEFLEWDSALKRTTRKISSLARAKYVKEKNNLHPGARLVISYFLDNAFELVLGADALARDPASLYKRLEESKSQFIDMFKEDVDGRSPFTISAIGEASTARLRMVDEDGDGKLELGVAVASGEGTVSLVDLVNQARGATAALIADPDSQKIDFTAYPLLKVLNDAYGLVNSDGSFKSPFELAGHDAGGASAVAASA